MKLARVVSLPVFESEDIILKLRTTSVVSQRRAPSRVAFRTPELSKSRARLLDSSGVRNATLEGALLWDTTDVVRNFKIMSSDSNTGRDTTLASFITRAKSSYNAQHFVLALKGDGAGWEG